MDQILCYEKVFVTEFATNPKPETRRALNKRYRGRIASLPDPRKTYGAKDVQFEALRLLSASQKAWIKYKLEQLESYYDGPQGGRGGGTTPGGYYAP
jgi:uncharacterized protein YecT (DUF1311 family)